MLLRTGQSPDRPPAHTTLPAAGIRTMTGQEAPVSAVHARMLNHTLDKYQYVKLCHPHREGNKSLSAGQSDGLGKINKLRHWTTARLR